MDAFLAENGMDDRAKRSRLADSLEQLLARQATKAAEDTRKSLDEVHGRNMDALLTKCAAKAVQEAASQWEDRCKQTEEKMEQTEKELKKMVLDLKQDITEMKNGSAASGSSTRVSAGQPATVTTRPPFCPCKLEVKGWVKNWEMRDDQMVTKAEALEWWRNMVTALPDDVQPLVDMDKLEQMNNRLMLAKLLVPVKGGQAECWKLRNAVTKIIKEDDINVCTMLGGVEPRVNVELPPWKRPLIAAGGKLMGWLERKKEVRELRVEWGPPVVIWHKPAGADRPTRIAELADVEKGWKVQETNLSNIAGGTTAAELLEAMRG